MRCELLDIFWFGVYDLGIYKYDIVVSRICIIWCLIFICLFFLNFSCSCVVNWSLGSDGDGYLCCVFVCIGFSVGDFGVVWVCW